MQGWKQPKDPVSSLELKLKVMAMEAETTIYVGVIPKGATEDTLVQHFEKYGDVLRCIILRDSITNASRGYGFVTFASSYTLDKVFQHQHIVCGKQVAVGRAVQKSRHYTKQRNWNNDAQNNTINNDIAQLNTNKIFVGGLPSHLTENDIENHFKKYGTVTNVFIVRHRVTKKPRGFGFVSFKSEMAAEDALRDSFQELNGKTVQVKRAVPEPLEKKANYENGDVGLVVPYNHPHYGYIEAIVSSPCCKTYGLKLNQNDPASSPYENLATGYSANGSFLHGGSNMSQWSNDAGDIYRLSRRRQSPWYAM